MIPVSQHFVDEIRRGAELVTYAEIIRNGEVRRVAEVLGGQVTQDATASVRGRCNVTLSADDDDRAIPRQGSQWASCAMWPTGNLIALHQAVRYPHGDLAEEVIPLGTYRLKRPVTTDDGIQRLVSIEAYDVSLTIARSRVRDVYVIDGGTPASDAIRELLKAQAEFLTDEDFDFVETDGSIAEYNFRVPRAVLSRTDDPWAISQQIAEACGFELFINRFNRVTFQPLPDPSHDEPIIYYDEGDDDTILAIDRALDDEDSYSGVIVTGESTELDVPIRAEAWDENPLSSTYYDPNGFGRIPYFITSEFIYTQAQAEQAAQLNLPKHVGITEEVSFSSLPMFWHDANDVVGITRDRIRTEGAYVMQAYTLGLGPQGTLNATTKARQLVL